jgi:hypothetical protein
MSASDHGEHLPQSLSSMTNSYGQPVFGWPIVLYCRFDTGRIAPADWTEVGLCKHELRSASRAASGRRRPLGALLAGARFTVFTRERMDK